MSIRKVVRKDGSARWEVRVHEKGRGSKRIKRCFDRKNEAENFLFDFQNEIKKKEQDPFHGASFKERAFQGEAEYWIKDGELRFSQGHIVRVRSILSELLPRYGHKTIDFFTPEFLTKYQQEEKAKGLSNSTVNRKTEVIVAILNCSAKHRRIPFNPSTGFKKLRKDSPEMMFWTKEEALSFLDFTSTRYPKGHSKRWVYTVYLMALNTAMRAGEIWGLKVCDIAPDGKSLWVRRQFNRVTMSFSETKSKKTRHVPCPSVLLTELHGLIQARNLKSDCTLFCNERGLPICHDNFLDRQFGKDLKVWGGRQIRFHDLRHTATTLMIAMGFDIKTVKEVCGHADIATTMNYVHMVTGAVEKMSDLFALAPERKEERVLKIIG